MAQKSRDRAQKENARNKKNRNNILKAALSYESDDRDDKVRGKSIAVCVTALLLLAVLLLRFAYLQFLKGDYYSKKAYAQQNSWRTISARRGTITDRNGNVLAISVSSCLINVNQKIIKDSVDSKDANKLREYQEKIARGLTEILNVDYDKTLEKIQSEGRYKVIAEKVDIETGDKVKAWIKEEKIKGVYVDEDTTRYYPNNQLACHLLGFTGRDDQGLVCGVEVALDSMLTGTPGRIITAVDASGNELPYDEIRRLDPKDGNNVTLTIDATIQNMVEKALEAAIEKENVLQGGAIVVMQPDTGDVLAMASYPYFNLNDPYAAPKGYEEGWTGNTNESVKILSETVWRNKALTDTYEPGSTFKSVTASIGIEEGFVNQNTMVSDSPLTMSGWTISCWRRGNDHGTETFAEAVKNSCNPVFAKLAVQSIGLETFYKYLEAFGFREKTGIMLSGEANSIFHQNPTEIDMAVTAFGQRVQITPIQLAAAYCAIANGGKLLQPRIVKEITDSDGIVVQSYDTQIKRQVISESTSKSVLEMLEQVVASGTGSNAYVSGYRVAGKTGTSQTTTTDIDGRYIASFCGIAPADDPEIVILVMLDHPNSSEGSASGGRQAAPVAGELIEKILTYMEIERRYTDIDSQNMMVKNYVPNVTGMKVSDAITELKSAGFSYTLPDADENADLTQLTVEEQIPRYNSYIMSGSKVVLYTSADTVRQSVIMPNLIGYTLEDAISTLNELGINVQANSIGEVVSQSIPEGTQVNKGSVVVLDLINNDTESMG